VVAWASITLGTAFVQSYGGLIVARLCLGITEAGLFPCINMYITMNFRPEEQGVRFSYIYLCAALSGAFGGLLAYGLVQMDGVAGWAGWRWLYAIEGAITMCLAPVAFFWLPNSLETAWFLTAEERELCHVRAEVNKHYRSQETFSWGEVRRAAIDWKTWL
jgi:MFS family permease